MEIVSALAHALREDLGRERFELWFGAHVEFSIAGDRLLVQSESGFFQDWLRSNFPAELRAACRRVCGRELTLEFGVRAPDAPASSPRAAEPPSAPTRSTPAPSGGPATLAETDEAALRERVRPVAGSRPTRELAEFVVSPANRIAYVAAECAATGRGATSPLVLHGPAGCGKTHLLEAACHRARRSAPRRLAVYLSAEQFTSLFLEALRSSGLPSFRRKYRGLDLLAIDDVQFLSNKKATIEELLHTLDTLQRDGKQVVLASRRAPAELVQLGPELTGRLRGGLVCGLDAPDGAARQEIVRRLAARHEFALGSEVADYVARSFTGDVRELAGAVHRLRAVGLARGAECTLSLAEEALADLVGEAGRAVRLIDVERAVCDAFGLEAAALRSESKSQDVTYPRMLAMCLARKHTRAALSEISRHFGRRSHTTVLSAQRKVEQLTRAGKCLQLGRRQCSFEIALAQLERDLLAAS